MVKGINLWVIWQKTEQDRLSSNFTCFSNRYLTHRLNTSTEQLSKKAPGSLSVTLLPRNQQPGKNIAICISLN